MRVEVGGLLGFILLVCVIYLRGCENRGELRFHKGQSRVDCGVVIVAPVWFYSVADLRAPQALMAKYLKPEREVGAHVVGVETV